MKITFVLPYAGLAGGVRVVAIHAERLRRQGHDVLVVSRPKKKPGMRQVLRGLTRGRLPKPSDEGHPYLDGTGVPHRILERVRPVRDSDLPDADVVVATWWDTAFGVAALSPEKGRKLYFIQHHEVHEHIPSVSAETYRLPLKKITISQWLVDIMADVYGDRDVDLVPNSVDRAQFHAPPRGKQAKPTVGLLYSLKPFKGVDVSLRAIAQAREAIPDLQIVAFGTEEPSGRLPLPEGSQFFLKPPQDRLRDIYALCDVWLCGSRTEGFHLPPLEAMACRCPVVSTAVGGSMDIIDEGANGHLTAVEDDKALAERLAAVLAQPEPQWRRMSDAALSRAESYSWDDATDLLEASFTRAVKGMAAA